MGNASWNPFSSKKDDYKSPFPKTFKRILKKVKEPLSLDKETSKELFDSFEIFDESNKKKKKNDKFDQDITQVIQFLFS